MARIRVPQNSFQFGEVSPSLTSRTDSAIYKNAAERVRNFFIRGEGGLTKRPGTKRWANLGTFTPASFTITVSDYANIVVGSFITLKLNDGTLITLEFQASSGSSPSASVGNTHYVRANESNNTTADNIYTALNAVSGLTVANPGAAVVTVTRDVGGSQNLVVTTTDATRLTTIDFTIVRQEVRIEPFIFSDDEQYIIAFSNTRIEIFQISPTDATISSIQAITSQSWLVNTTSAPYLEEITFAQQGDIMFICHQTFSPRKLVRTGLTAFAVEAFAFETSVDSEHVFQPYYSFQPLGVTIASNATSGTGRTLTASADYFVSGHVNAYLKIGDAEVKITAVTNATTATATIYGTLRHQLDNDALKTAEGSGTIQVTHALHGLAVGASIVIDRAGTVGGVVIANINGTRTVTAVVNENVYEFLAGSSATATSSADGGGAPRVATAAATTQWSEQSYSAVRGYPAAVTFHQNRLWFGGTLAQPDGIWGSKSGQYYNFDTGTGEDNDALDLTANVGEISTIRHLVSNRDLQVFTTGAELFVQAPVDKPVTPANAQIKRQTPYGASYVKPTVFDGATLFIQSTGSALREFLFADTEASYTSVAVSMLAPHLIVDPVQQTAIKGALARSESYNFVLNSDGTMAVFYSIRGDQKQGWSLWDTSGNWHSICSVRERLFAIATRDDGSGTTKMFLEEFQVDMPMDFCDEFSATSSVFGSLTSHFSNGAVVKAISGNDYLGEFTISGAAIDASLAKSSVSTGYIGYAFIPLITTLPVDAQIIGGPLTGEPRRISRVILDLHSTLAVSVNDKDLVFRNVTDDMSLAKTPVTGKEEFRILGYSRDPRVSISQSYPFSLELNGMVVEVAFG